MKPDGFRHWTVNPGADAHREFKPRRSPDGPARGAPGLSFLLDSSRACSYRVCITTPRRRPEPPARTADIIILWDNRDERPRTIPADSKEEAEGIATEVRNAVYYLRRWGGPEYGGLQCRPYVEPAEGRRKPWQAVFMVHRPFFPTA